MAENIVNDFTIPEMYSDPKYELGSNKDFAENTLLSAKNTAKKYLTEFLGVKIEEKDITLQILGDIIEKLPEYYRREGFLHTVDIRPLLQAAADEADGYKLVTINENILLPTNNKYREVVGAKIKSDEATNDNVLPQDELDIKVEEILDAGSGWSPTKYIGATDPTTIKEGRDFGLDPNISTGFEGQSYTEFLRAHATATIEDLMQYEESGAVASKEDAFMPKEFITNLTGEVSGIDWTGKKVTWNLQQAKEYIWNLDDKKIPDLQNSLRDAGYFDKLQMYPMEGQRDQATALAWDMFLADTLRNNQSPATRLKGASDDFAKRLASGQGNLFMDEENIKGAASALGSQVLGRSLDISELNALTVAVRNWEREQYKMKSTGEGVEGDVFSQVDIESRINNYLKNTYAEEAVWTNYANSRQATERYFGN